MAKGKGKNKRAKDKVEAEVKDTGRQKESKVCVDDHAGRKFIARAYEKELAGLHVKLVKLQEWVRHKGLKVCIVFEGRDGAGTSSDNPWPPGSLRNISGDY